MASPSGYSGKPLWEKLGLRPGTRVFLFRETEDPVPSYWEDAPFPVEVSCESSTAMEFVHLFVVSRRELLARVAAVLPGFSKTGVWWVSWPKAASGRRGDVTEDTLRDVFLPLGLVDIKVCSVTDELWSGLKLVWRKALR